MERPATGAEYLDLLGETRLLAGSQMAEIHARFNARSDQELQDPDAVARWLVEQHYITQFQADHLTEGRHRGFYFGPFKLLEVLGIGGMGRVYLAEQIRLERLVALKAIRRLTGSDETLARFEREAKVIASLHHPNIVQALDYDRVEGVPYLVMEYVEGIDLDRYVSKFGRVPHGSAAEFIRQAALGLQHAHEHGLVHRDIKPANLLVDTTGTVKILDLGLATAAVEGRVAAERDVTTTAGSVYYIATEQISHADAVDGRADIYSLGAVLYTLIAGRPPFRAPDPREVLKLHLKEYPKPIQAEVPEVPRGLASVIRKMLAKRREDRFHTAWEVYEALSPFSRRVFPPYPFSTIRFRRRDLRECLRRSPTPAELDSFAKSQSGASAAEDDPTVAEAESGGPSDSRLTISAVIKG